MMVGMFGGPMIMAQVNGTPQSCAMVNSTTNIVENIIVADPAADPAPAGYVLISLQNGVTIAVSWIYDPVTQTFTDPNPPAPPAE